MVAQTPPIQSYPQQNVQPYVQPYVQPPVQSYTQPNALTTPPSVAALSEIATNPMGAVDSANAASPNGTANANANANANATYTPDPAPAPTLPAALASDQFMNSTRPNTGVLTPPNKSDLPLSEDAIEQKAPSIPKAPKKGATGLNLVLIGQVAVCAIGAFYLTKSLKGVGKALAKVLNR